MKFPQGEGSAVIHRKKNRPALQRRDILTVFLVSFFILFFIFFIGNLLFFFFFFFIAFYTVPFSSEHFFLGLFLISFLLFYIFRALSTQLVFIVVLLLLLLSMNAFSCVGFLSLFRVRLFHAVYLSHFPSSSFLGWLSSEQFAELRSVHLLAFSPRACSLAFLFSGSPFLATWGAVFIFLFWYLVPFLWFVLIALSLSWLCWFQLFWGLIFLNFLGDFSCVFYRAFLLSGSVLSSRTILSSGNAYYQFPCRWHVTETLTGWFHP